MPANIKDLPVEILSMIFQYCVSEFYIPSWRYGGALSEWSRMRDKEQLRPGRDVFPFNAAGVCMVWFDILKSSPRYWQRTLIDVAQDPTPFLDVFKLFECEQYDYYLDVIVFSSLKGAPGTANEAVDEAQKYIENARARTIFEHLKSCIRHCSSIMFDVVYQSSLPSAAHILAHRLDHLQELSLTCTTYDYNAPERNFEEMTSPLQTPFACLTKLSLTGLAFMELCQPGHRLHELVSSTPTFELSINNFNFISPRVTSRDPVIDNCESFVTFKEALENLSRCCSLELSFSDISMDYLPITSYSYEFPGIAKLSFDNVSSDFLSAFFTNVYFVSEELEYISFRRCQIPRILSMDYELGADSEGLTLELVDIPTEPSSPRSTTPHRSLNQSICNALEMISPQQVSLVRCDGVTDDFLRWLSGDESTSITAPELNSLTIRQCTGFTSGGIRSLIEDRRMRNDDPEMFDDDDIDVSAIEDVLVENGPEVSEDDVAYFLENTHVRWNVD